jgi:hypothetical protein
MHITNRCYIDEPILSRECKGKGFPNLHYEQQRTENFC